MLTAELSWRWVLFVNVPIGAALFAVGRPVPDRRPATRRHAPRLDVAGAVTVTAGLAALVYAIVGTDTHPWGSAQTLSVLAVASPAGAFMVLELRVASEPLVPLRLFRSRPLTGSNVVMLLVGAAFFSMWYFLSLYLQNVLGFDALRAGLSFLPMAVAIAIGARISARLVGRFGVRQLILFATALVAGGFWWLSQIGPDSTYWASVFGPGCIITFALGFMFTPLATGATTSVPQNEAGLASGVLNTSRQVGGSLGLAVLATIATYRATNVLVAGHGRVSLDARADRRLLAGVRARCPPRGGRLRRVVHRARPGRSHRADTR